MHRYRFLIVGVKTAVEYLSAAGPVPLALGPGHAYCSDHSALEIIEISLRAVPNDVASV